MKNIKYTALCVMFAVIAYVTIDAIVSQSSAKTNTCDNNIYINYEAENTLYQFECHRLHFNTSDIVENPNPIPDEGQLNTFREGGMFGIMIENNYFPSANTECPYIYLFMPWFDLDKENSSEIIGEKQKIFDDLLNLSREENNLLKLFVELYIAIPRGSMFHSKPRPNATSDEENPWYWNCKAFFVTDAATGKITY